MKNNIKPALCSLLVMMASGHANAADVAASPYPTGTLNISGKILDKGCTFEAKDMVIQLAPVQNSDFTAVSDLGPKSDPVNFNLTGCPANSTLKFTVAGTAGATTSSFKIATATNSATGFDILLYGPEADGIVTPNTAKTLTTDSSGNYSGTLAARITSNSTTHKVGIVDTTFTYTLAYN